MKNGIDRLTDGEVESGVYRLDMSLRPSTICHRVVARGWACFYLDGANVFDKASLLAQLGEAMDFPDYYGQNWDALEECITELSWLGPSACVLLYDHASVLAGQHPDVFATFLDVMQLACEYWSQRSRPFYVLLRNTGELSHPIPTL
ncbi:MAG: barstar family protein [Caldilineaceae bacterium]